MLDSKSKSGRYIKQKKAREKDPKIYLKMCRRFGDRVKGVFIREIAERPLETDLFRKLQASTPAGNCKKFSTAKELANLSSEIFVQ